jgi:hypothetical protein
VPQNNSLHDLDLVRRMQDYDLALLPQSKISIRLGYSRNRDEGPGLFTTNGTSVSGFQENNSYTTNAYRAGIDVKILPRTTLSFDEFLTYYKQDNSIIDNPAVNPGNFGFVLGTVPGQSTPAGTPVDLGDIWSTQTGAKITPCATPIVAGTINTATPDCAGQLSYSQVGNPRNFIPTERFRFQSNYFKNFEMSGALGYSSSDYHFSDLAENDNSFKSSSKSPQRGDTAAGPIKTKRVSVNANWSGVYAVNEKLRILDEFRYDNWRIPGVWDSAETNVFGTPAPNPNVVGLLLAQGVFNSTNCPVAPFNQANCPSHLATSNPDVSNAINEQFLGQNIKSNTLEFQYDFNRRYSGTIGYLYTNRTISSSSATFNTGTFYFPGGADGTAANFFDAARGDCALVGGVLPAACTLITTGSLAGAIVEASPSNPIPSPNNDTSRSITTINENALLLGFVARPIDELRITANFEFGYNDQSFTRIDPRHLQSYKIHASYKPRPWADLDGAVEIHENRDNVSTVNNIEHDNSYSFSALLMGNQRLSVDFGYNYWNVYSQSLVCFPFSIKDVNGVTVSAFPSGVPVLPGGTACPITGSPSPLGALSTYSSKDNFAHAAVIWKPANRVTVAVGYGGSFVRGNTIFLNPLTPSGTLNFNYQRPYASIAFNIYRGFSYKMAWNYYGYNETGVTNPFGLAALQSQDFNGSNATFSFQYSF